MNANSRLGKGFSYSRRRLLISGGLLAASGWLAPQRLLAQNAGEDGVVGLTRRDAANAKITVESLRGNVSVLIGSGGNIAVLTGPEGKLLVDAGLTASRPRIAEALNTLSAAPIKHLINTHWHFDHTDGNEWLHGEGATIVAHTHTRKHLATATRVEGWNFTFPPAPKGALPTVLVEKQRTLRFNGAVLALQYYGPCHTDSDLSVYFPEADLLHTGDTWWNGHYPFIDYSTGGSINGMIRATEANLARVTERTIVIPGHGPVGGRSHLAEYREMLVTLRDRVAALKQQGKSLEEVIAARPTAAYDEKWGGFFIKPDTFASLLYAGV